MSYLMNVTLPGDKNEFKKVRYQAIRYVIMDNQLHKHRYSIPLLKCLMPKDEIMSHEIHEGIYGNHFRGQLAYKTMR